MSSIRDFVPLMKLGQGSYSSVYKVRRLTDHQIYALKKVKLAQLTTKEKENALNQIRILASIDSDYIVGYKEAFFDEKLSVLCIVMEYADGGDLHQIITERRKKGIYLPERQIWIAAKHILKGLADLHCKNIMHRDLKSANIFKSAIKYKLGDLNVSKVNNQGHLAYTQTGTPYYASPQVWRDEPYDSKSDIWSFGCILYEMAALRPPYQGNDMEELYKNVQEKQVSGIPQQYSADLWQMIQLCLQKKAGFRPSANQLLQNAKFSKIFDKYDITVHEDKPTDQSIQQKLLQTIKLPSDLKNLKQNLPSSKYSSQVKCKENKSMLQLEGNSNQISTNIPLKSNIPNQIPISNKSEVYQSPSARMKLDQYSKLLKSPVSQIKLSQHSSQQRVKYSQRLHVSDKKSNKVENPNVDRPVLNVQKYIREQLSRRPPTSIPRTEKVTSREVKVNLPAYSRQIGVGGLGSPRQGLQELRKRLAKKSRVLSGNNPRPSWWN